MEVAANPTQTVLANQNENSNDVVNNGNDDVSQKLGDIPAELEPGPAEVGPSLANTTPASDSKPKIVSDEISEDFLTAFCRASVASSQGTNKNSEVKDRTSVTDSVTSSWYLNRKKNDTSGFNLLKFLTACIASQLKSLGMEELDCKELIDSWLSHRRQRRWGQKVYKSATIFPNQSKPASNPCLQAHQLGMTNLLAVNSADFRSNDIFGPSEPNSSLLRLSEEGNVDLGHFLSRMEEVRGNINNACCTLLQSLSLLMMPYLKLLSGNQLETTCSRSFILDFMRILKMMSYELDVDTHAKETLEMTQREFRIVLQNAKDLNKLFLKMYKRFKQIFEDSNSVSERALSRIHPKGLTPYNRGRIKQKSNSIPTLSMSSTFLSDCIQFSQIPLYHANFTPGEICKNHLLFSISREGSLVFKEDIEQEWRHFSTLSFIKRRDLFLSVAEDIQWCLKHALASASHAKVLIKEGYPENIHAKINENLAYLKSTAKRSDDIIVLSKVSIVTQVHSVRESSARLVRILRDAYQISRFYYKCIKAVKNKLPAAGCPPFTNLRKKQVSKIGATMRQCSLKFDASKVKFLIPLPASTDPLEDPYFMTFV